MILYGSYTSPFVRHCRVALAQSGFDFEFVEADYAMSAERSPTAKVPFFSDGDIMLTDSSSILKFVREKSGKPYLKDIQDYELFTITNTVLDTSINLFLLENEGFGPGQINYLSRQQNRIESGLNELNTRFSAESDVSLDSSLRCACFLDWALFRDRITLDGLDNLQGLLDQANQDEVFTSTAPNLT